MAVSLFRNDMKIWVCCQNRHIKQVGFACFVLPIVLPIELPIELPIFLGGPRVLGPRVLGRTGLVLAWGAKGPGPDRLGFGLGAKGPGPDRLGFGLGGQGFWAGPAWFLIFRRP